MRWTRAAGVCVVTCLVWLLIIREPLRYSTAFEQENVALLVREYLKTGYAGESLTSMSLFLPLLPKDCYAIDCGRPAKYFGTY
jgi:hypothetical protein